MTKKITIALEESYIDELSEFAKDTGKKKVQIIREASQNYFDTNALTKTVQEYKSGGSRVKFIHKDKSLVVSLHKPHPSNTLKEYIVKQIQEVLKGFKDGNA